MEEIPVQQPASQQPQQQRSQTIDLPGIHRIIAVMSGKGGVGKSTVSAALAIALAKEGNLVALLDADLHGPNLPRMLGVSEALVEPIDEDTLKPVPVGPGLDMMSIGFLTGGPDTPVVWRGPLKMAAIRQFLGDVAWGDRDFMVIDLPPGTGDEPLSIAQLLPDLFGAVILTTPQEVSVEDARRSVAFARALKVPVLGIIENMSGVACPHCGEGFDLFKSGGGERIAGELEVPFLGRIPLDPALVEAADSGQLAELGDSSPALRALSGIAGRIASMPEH